MGKRGAGPQGRRISASRERREERARQQEHHRQIHGGVHTPAAGRECGKQAGDEHRDLCTGSSERDLPSGPGGFLKLSFTEA